MCEERAGLVVNALEGIRNKVFELDNTIKDIVEGAPEGEFFDQPEKTFEVNQSLPMTEME